MTGNQSTSNQSSKSITIEGQPESHCPVRKGSGLSTTVDTNTTAKDSDDSSSPASAVIDFPTLYRSQSRSISEEKVCQITISSVEDDEIASSQQIGSNTHPILSIETKAQVSHSEDITTVDTLDRREEIKQELDKERIQKEAERKRLEQELALERTVTDIKQQVSGGEEDHIEESSKRAENAKQKEVVTWRQEEIHYKPREEPLFKSLEEESRRKFQRQQLLSQQRKQREVAKAQALRLREEKLERRKEADLKKQQCHFPPGTHSIVIPGKAMESSAQYYNDQVHLAAAHGREHRQHIDHGRQEDNRNFHGRGAMNGLKRREFRRDENSEEPLFLTEDTMAEIDNRDYMHQVTKDQNDELIHLRKKCDDLERRLEAKSQKCTELENLLITKEQSHNKSMEELDNELQKRERARKAIENKYISMNASHANRFNNEKDFRQRSKNTTKRGKGKVRISIFLSLSQMLS